MKNKLIVSALCAALLMLCTVFSVSASVSYLMSAPEQANVKNGQVSIQVLFMNTGSKAERFQLPSKMTVYVETAEGKRSEILAESGLKDEWVDLTPGTFKSRRYLVPVKVSTGTLKISLENNSSSSVSLMPETEALPVQEGGSVPESSEFITGDLAQGEAQLDGRNDRQHNAMVDYFHEHFFGYDPIYFILGGNPSGGDPQMKGAFPNTRFQISLRYTPFSADTWIADKWSGITNVFVTYTQNTEWDMEGESAPFLDSMFKPELQYFWRDIFKEKKGILERMDLTAAISHESNGRNGAGSRSINYVIARPTLYFGDQKRLNGYLAPGFWFYFGSISDNPEIRHYRGHADVKAAIQWADSVQLASLFRMGDELEKGSMQLDLTYPLGEITGDGLDIYLHVQYFTGYGQTLLNYNRREQALRAGFSFYR